MAQPARAAARCARLRRPFSRQNLPDTMLVVRIYRAVPGKCLALHQRRAGFTRRLLSIAPAARTGLVWGFSPPKIGQPSMPRRSNGSCPNSARCARTRQDPDRPAGWSTPNGIGNLRTPGAILPSIDSRVVGFPMSVIYWNRFNIHLLPGWRPSITKQLCHERQNLGSSSANSKSHPRHCALGRHHFCPRRGDSAKTAFP